MTPRARTVVFLVAPLLLYACGQPASPQSTDPYAGGARYPWTYTRPAGQLSAQSLTPGVNTLYYEPILAAANGWGPVEINRSNGEQRAGDGRPLTLDGMTYRTGFGVHAGSELRFSLTGSGATCTRFTADIGVDDEVGSRGSVVFQVYLDGVKAYDSGVMTGSSATKRPGLDITGKQELRLVVTDAGNGISYDHADWANPQITCSQASGAGRLDTTFGSRGYVRTPNDGPENRDHVLEPDTSVVALAQDFSVKRLSPDGTVTATGRADIPGEPPRVDGFEGGSAAYALARQPDGRLVAVGKSFDSRAVVVRFLPNLQLDPTFGEGGIVVKQLGVGQGTDFFTAASSAATDAVVLADGRTVLVGGATRFSGTALGEVRSEYMAARLTPTGQLDPTFGTQGVVIITGTQLDPVLAPNELGYSGAGSLAALALHPDGRIVAAGSSGYDRGALPTVLRLLSDGRLDPSFSGDGIASFTVQPGVTRDFIFALTLESTGRILAGGLTGQQDPTRAFVVRLSPAGTLNGKAVFPVGPSSGHITSLALQQDGKIVFGAASEQGYGVGRLTADLRLDTAFGASGTGLVQLPELQGPFDDVWSVQVDTLDRTVALYPTAMVRLTP